MHFLRAFLAVLGLALLSGCGTSSSESLETGSQVQLLEEAGDFAKIETDSGQVGYVSAGLLKHRNTADYEDADHSHLLVQNAELWDAIPEQSPSPPPPRDRAAIDREQHTLNALFIGEETGKEVIAPGTCTTLYWTNRRTSGAGGRSNAFTPIARVKKSMVGRIMFSFSLRRSPTKKSRRSSAMRAESFEIQTMRRQKNSRSGAGMCGPMNFPKHYVDAESWTRSDADLSITCAKNMRNESAACPPSGVLFLQDATGSRVGAFLH